MFSDALIIAPAVISVTSSALCSATAGFRVHANSISGAKNMITVAKGSMATLISCDET